MAVICVEAGYKVRLLCEDCKEERVVQRNTGVLDKEEHPCRVCSNKRNGVVKRGRPAWNSGWRKPEHEIQKGSKYLNYHGYNEIYVGEKEAKLYGRNKGKYVIEHRKVMQDFLGRPLLENEIIHHIDGDKLNNDLSNLYICNSMSEHRDMHNSLENVSMTLVKEGVIKFEKGRYFIDVDHIVFDVKQRLMSAKSKEEFYGLEK